MRTARAPRQARSSERGAFGILYAVMLPTMLAMVGLAVDLSIAYARGHELQTIADGAALAAARALDGTTAGIAAAKANARSTARLEVYRFLHSETIEWSPAALSVGPTPDGPWTQIDAVAAASAPTMMFARVDTASLAAVYGRVAVSFLRIVGVAGEQNMSRHAVAGRQDTNLAPLAVCALNNAQNSVRSNTPALGAQELLEYGFRRGVGYNLLNLGPTTVAQNYVVNPIDFPPAVPVPAHQNLEAVRPFVCTGAMPAPVLQAGSRIYVSNGFPLSYVPELNSRFADFSGGSVCNRFSAAPDANIKDFRGGYPLYWMNSGTSAQLRGSALPLDQSTSSGSPGGDKKVTIADVDGIPAGTVAAHYGPLWAYARPRRYDPATGTMGPEFAKGDWSKLYPVSSGAQLATSWNKSTLPYEANASPNRLTPEPLTGVSRRRVLNVPLLACPVVGGSVVVLGIGSFLMTSRATVAPPAIYAEFGGLVNYGKLTASAVLYQ